MAETEAEVKEHVSHYDPVHHTEEGGEQLAQELAAAHLSSTGGSTSDSTQRTPVPPSKAEGPPPESSPLHPGVGPVSGQLAPRPRGAAAVLHWLLSERVLHINNGLRPLQSIITTLKLLCWMCVAAGGQGF